MRKIVYLGGFYVAERSFQKSLKDHGIDVVFPVDQKYRNFTNAYSVFYGTEVKSFGITQVPENNLNSYLMATRPEVVIHRYYLNDSLMHKSAYDVCKRLGIPYVVYRMETFPLAPIDEVKCDLFLYAHLCDEEYLPKTKNYRMYHYPYGVSGYERPLDVGKFYELAMFGFGRLTIPERKENFKMYYSAIASLGKVLDVFWSNHDKDVFRNNFKDSKHIKFNDQFKVDLQEEYLNRAKIIINLDTAYKVEHGYSHKMFQSLGCGIPTITQYKKGIEDEFGPNWENAVYVNNEEDVKSAIKILLKDQKLCNKLSVNSTTYMHEYYDWYYNLSSIFKKEGIW